MKKFLALALALVMVFALAACGEKEPNPSGNGTSDPGTSQQTPSGGNTADMGDDDVPYKFPKVETYSEWPDSSVWAEMGVPDLTPAVMNNGEIFNGGDTYTEGFSFGYTAQCDSDEASFHALADLLWNEGYRGFSAGNGIIVEAQNKNQLISDNPNSSSTVRTMSITARCFRQKLKKQPLTIRFGLA